MNKVRFVSIGGILTAFTVLFQSAPLFFPAIGLLLSPFSTLPIAIATFYRVSLGITVYVSSIMIVAFVNVQEAVILLFTTGPLGVVTGALLFRKGIVVSIVFSAITLFLGMISLTYIIGISPFGPLTDSTSLLFTIVIFTIFAFIYASIWNVSIRKLMNRMNR